VDIVEEIRGGMGLPAKRASSATQPEINDIVIRGYLLSVDEGSATKRVAIGFGSGASHLTTEVEGYQMTAYGLRKLGSGKVGAGGGKAPGAAVGLDRVNVATLHRNQVEIGPGCRYDNPWVDTEQGRMS